VEHDSRRIAFRDCEVWVGRGRYFSLKFRHEGLCTIRPESLVGIYILSPHTAEVLPRHLQLSPECGEDSECGEKEGNSGLERGLHGTQKA
jgi:hypothetical protein